MKRAAFTLVELLIVVVIIAILAAIAIPNFLEAQIRSKVSRARTDLRTVAVALESYAADENKYPPMLGHWGQEGHRENGYGYSRNEFWIGIPPQLSTPIAYLTHLPIDVFKIGTRAPVQLDETIPDLRPFNSGDSFDMTLFFFNNLQYGASQNRTTIIVSNEGLWRIDSLGPGAIAANDHPDQNLWHYDASNGTISLGYISRTQKDPEAAAWQEP